MPYNNAAKTSANTGQYLIVSFLNFEKMACIFSVKPKSHGEFITMNIKTCSTTEKDSHHGLILCGNVENWL